MYGWSGCWYILNSDFSRQWLSNEKSTLNWLIESGGPTTRVAKNQRHVERICHFRAADQDRRPEREKNHSTTLSTLENVSSRPLWRSWTRLSATNHPAIVTNRPNLVAVETRFTHTNFFYFHMVTLHSFHLLCNHWLKGGESVATAMSRIPRQPVLTKHYSFDQKFKIKANRDNHWSCNLVSYAQKLLY